MWPSDTISVHCKSEHSRGRESCADCARGCMVRWLPQAFREVHAKTWHLSWSIAWENIGTVPAKHCNPRVHFSYGGFHVTVFMILRFSCFIWKEIYVTAYYTSSRCLSSGKREVEWKYRKNMCCSTGGLVCTYLWLCLLVCSKFCFWRWCPSLQDRFWYLLRPPLHLLLLKLLLTPSSSPQSVCWANLS